MPFQGNRQFGGRNPMRGSFPPRMQMPGFNAPQTTPAAAIGGLLPALVGMAERPFFGVNLRPQVGSFTGSRPRGPQPGLLGSPPPGLLGPSPNNNYKTEAPRSVGELKESTDQKPRVQPVAVSHRSQQRNTPNTSSSAIKTERPGVQQSGGNEDGNNDIQLDEYNMDLHVSKDDTGLTGWTLHKNGFEYLWGGARATHGVKHGKVAYECHVTEALPVKMPPYEKNPHVLRVGWSVDDADLQLGEDHLSYGYGGTGKSSTNGKFSNYGRPFSVGDVITCHLDLDSQPKTVFFMVNGDFLGVAFKIGPELGDRALFPHITCKNMKFTLNFGSRWPDFPITPGFTMMQNMPSNILVRAPSGPASRKDAEVIMMVGLPACGKTVWAEKYCKEHPEKKYYMLGTNNIIDKMRLMGLSRKRNYHGRWDALIQQASECLRIWFRIAEKRIRNYIIDQTNVYPSARKKKMKNFSRYKRIACVIVNNNEVLAERTKKREKEEGKFVPTEAIMEMKSNFTLPEVGESFDKVLYIEEKPPEAQNLVDTFREEGLRFKHGTKRHAEEGQYTDSKVPRIDPGGPSKEDRRSNPGQRSDETQHRQRLPHAERDQRDGVQHYAGREDARGAYAGRDRANQAYGGRDVPTQAGTDRIGMQQSYPNRDLKQETVKEEDYPSVGRDEARQPYQDSESFRQPYRGRDEARPSYPSTEIPRQTYGEAWQPEQREAGRYGGRDESRQSYGQRDEAPRPYRERERVGQPYEEREPNRGRKEPADSRNTGMDRQFIGDNNRVNQLYDRNESWQRARLQQDSERDTYTDGRGSGSYPAVIKEEPRGYNVRGAENNDFVYSANREAGRHYGQSSSWQSHQDPQRDESYGGAGYGGSSQNRASYSSGIRTEAFDREEAAGRGYNRDTYGGRSHSDGYQHQKANDYERSRWSQSGYRNDSTSTTGSQPPSAGQYYGTRIKQEPADDAQRFPSYEFGDGRSQSNRDIPPHQLSQSNFPSTVSQDYNRDFSNAELPSSANDYRRYPSQTSFQQDTTYSSSSSNWNQGSYQQPQGRQWYQ